MVEQIITKLIKGGAKAEQIGVITPYEGQRAYVVSYIQQNSNIDVASYQVFNLNFYKLYFRILKLQVLMHFKVEKRIILL